MPRIISLIALLLALPVQASTFLWEVTHKGNRVFLGGTVHVLSKQDYPLPQAFNRAYQQSEIITFETDLASAAKPEFGARMLQTLSYQDGSTLQSHLKPETFRNLSMYCASRRIPMKMLMNMKPMMLTMTLTILELQRLGLAGAGADEHFFVRGLKDKKTLFQLETNDDQLNALKAMDGQMSDKIVQKTLDDMRDLGQEMGKMKKAWRTGDTASMKKLVLDEFKRDYPKIFDIIGVQRNLRWIPQIEAMLNTPKTELVLVGALHLVGEQGLIQLLKAKGYQIRQL